MDAISPADFIETASRAVAACAGKEAAAQARILAEDGLLGILADEDAGGLALDAAFAVPVLEAAGAGLLDFPLLETMLLARLLPAEFATPLVEGAARGSIAWTGGLEHGAAGRAPMGEGADILLVRAGTDAAALLRLDDPGITLLPDDGMDVDVPEASFRLKGAVPVCQLPEGSWTQLQEEALLLRAAVMLGGAATCLAMATEHVTNRRQFGKPLVANQAVRHTLARHKLMLEGLRGVTERALATGTMTARRTAFSVAAQYAPAIAEGALHLHGGMGFTWDVPVHRHLRRLRALEAQGDVPAVRAALAASLIDTPHNDDFLLESA